MSRDLTIVFSIIALMSFAISSAGDTAITNNGKVVIINENGTWSKSAGDTTQGKYDFRKTRWGMSMDEVRKSEEGILESESKDEITYLAMLDSEYCSVKYRFSGGKLKIGKYIQLFKRCEKVTWCGAKVLGKFDNFEKMLGKKYGNSVEKTEELPIDSTLWKLWDFLIRKEGYCNIKYKNERTEISLFLGNAFIENESDSDKVMILIDYRINPKIDSELKAREKQVLDDL